jgi:Ankyrin repeats (3 copies)
MNRRFRGIRAISLVSRMMLIIAASAIVFPHKAVSQCPFNPNGYFYAKETPTAGFEDFDHLTLWGKRDKSDRSPRPGVYTARGEVYEFRARQNWPFEFTTATVNGISYSFAGKFRMVCIFEEEVRRHPEEVFAEGQLLKFENGEKVAETPVQFTYSPKLRNLKDDINALYPSGRSDLIYAVIESDITKLRDLLARGAKVNVTDERGKTALAYARNSSAGDAKALELARTLIDAGANLNLKDSIGMTVLMYAAYSYRDKEAKLFNMFLAAGADANAKDNYGITVLMHAVHAATTDAALIGIVKTLIRAKARVNKRNSLGQTALSISIKSKDKELINVLKRAGAR